MRWISVQDRMPGHAEYVLVSTGGVVTEMQWDEIAKMWDYHPDPTWEGIGGVSHWMPLPKPAGSEARRNPGAHWTPVDKRLPLRRDGDLFFVTNGRDVGLAGFEKYTRGPGGQFNHIGCKAGWTPTHWQAVLPDRRRQGSLADQDLVLLKILVRNLLDEIDGVPFRPIDCDQDKVYALMDALRRTVGLPLDCLPQR